MVEKSPVGILAIVSCVDSNEYAVCCCSRVAACLGVSRSIDVCRTVLPTVRSEAVTGRKPANSFPTEDSCYVMQVR